ncbi:MAG: 3-deoxy-7-phosphoheptulonate synthase [Spirochaetales bacterium]|nr:3-deoxy-7-phosphoheptulonate synthase [Spirochaetales bacterium]
MTHLILNPDSTDRIELQKFLEARGVQTYTFSCPGRDTIAAINVDAAELHTRLFPGENYRLVQIETSYILASRKMQPESTVITTRFNKTIGGKDLAVIAGPCSIESESQILTAATVVKETGASCLRGGAYKPRSSPYAFQGTGEKGLRMLKEAGDKVQLPVVTELLDADDLPLLREYCDIIQIGARNCQNFALLKKVGKIKQPVLLKRGLSTTIEELLLAAEYILSGGNMQVILCERGIRTFEHETRNTLDISAIPLLKQKTHLPVIADPSHAAGNWRLIEPLSLAAVAAGADGIMIEMHPTPKTALCDGKQSLNPEKFRHVMENIRNLSKYCRGRK